MNKEAQSSQEFIREIIFRILRALPGTVDSAASKVGIDKERLTDIFQYAEQLFTPPDLWTYDEAEENYELGDTGEIILQQRLSVEIDMDEFKKLIGLENFSPIRISEIRAEHMGRYIQINGQITGELSHKALPKSLKISCSKCDYHKTIELTQDEELLASYVFRDKNKRKAILRKYECTCGATFGDGSLRYEETGSIDYSIIWVRDLLENVEKFDKRVYTSRTVYVTNQALPDAKKVKIFGRVFVEPKELDIVIIANKIKPLETEFTAFKITEKDKENFPKYFNKESDITTQIAPFMVGRRNVQLAELLTLHSIVEIPDVVGTKIRGSIRLILFGDTKTCKSQSTKDFTLGRYRFGDYVVAESSSRAGITYTIDTEKKTIIWGALPLNDLGLVVIDGLHTVYANEMRELREALEIQRIIVRRSQSGEALARDRVIGIFNPEKDMADHYLKCFGIKDSHIFSKSPDITRWDIFIPFSQDDVDQLKIAKAKPEKRPIPDEVFKRHACWAWSRKPENISYTKGSKDLVIEESARVMKDYSISSLPIVHNGFREVLCRLAVAFASLEHSTDETHENVIVSEYHVEKAVKFYEEILLDLGLREHKLEEEGKLEITPSDVEEMFGSLGEREMEILKVVKYKPSTSTILAEKFDVTPKTIKNHYQELRRHGLIKTIPKVGVSITRRGIKFLKLIGHKDVKLTQEKDTTLHGY